MMMRSHSSPFQTVMSLFGIILGCIVSDDICGRGSSVHLFIRNLSRRSASVKILRSAGESSSIFTARYE
ncbi:hypothetical protein BC938DRAFT_477982 [Jimgerdemannia flammicorona]|uniref:Secreted protein n=1 Tax=Jimgerdemannia flammicorona TaxID=994334 RepID=A0A433QYN2_9FUNG|nr:hypothetical protein BC938DRAFT_477982 [Jimgerdemannia flammicorona]